MVKDYFQICEAYFDAVNRMPPSRIELLTSGPSVRFAINVWAGWAPIIYANGGMAAGKESKAV